MRNKIICDSGVISRYLLDEKPIINVINNKIGLENVVTTPLNRIELLNWLSGYQNLEKSKRARFLKFIKAIPLIHINEPISKQAIELSDKHVNSKPADTFIASIAIYHKIPIYTLNEKDFKTLKAPLLN
jgi:predicted nucleic acid-binding protein